MKLRLIVCAAAFAAGWTASEWRSSAEISELQRMWQAESVEAHEKANAWRQSAQNHSDRAGALLADLEAERKKNAKIITKRVVEYVQSPDAGQCVMPDGWVRIHDAAAAGVPKDTETASSSNENASAFTDADAIATIASNYDTCNEIRQQLTALQAWAAGISRD